MNMRILLIEPNYKNKYPPIGLMKIATYHRKLHKDHVRFFKGDMKDLLLELLSDSAVTRFTAIEEDIDWASRKIQISNYIRYCHKSDLSEITSGLKDNLPSILVWLKHYAKSYKSGKYDDCIKWDRIYVSTLFTFYWDLTVRTIQFAKRLLADDGKLIVGGVMATVAANQLEAETGIKPIVGLLDKPGMLLDDSIIVDELPLDYSILHEIEYIYPESNAYYGYMTRGCVRKCEFCAVPILEPEYKNFIPISGNVMSANEEYGEKRNLLLLDNNILASDHFDEIIEDIKLCGFAKDAVFIEPNKLEIAIRNLSLGSNDYAYNRLAYKEIIGLSKSLKGQTLLKYSQMLSTYGITQLSIPPKAVLLNAYPALAETYEKFRNKMPKKRHVDFNQGVDARFLDERKMKLLSELPIKPLRIAFDRMYLSKSYENAIRLAAKYGIRELSNYLLYNYDDEPAEFYQRLKLNIKLCEELEISIYSFPMKYNPINDKEGYFKNRTFIGKHWNKKYLRAIQLVLNSTKGKVGKGKGFFEEAFGKNEEQFFEILYMPEAYILNRMYYKHNGTTQKWLNSFNALTREERAIVLPIIETNCIDKQHLNVSCPKLIELLAHYECPANSPDKLAANC